MNARPPRRFRAPRSSHPQPRLSLPLPVAVAAAAATLALMAATTGARAAAAPAATPAPSPSGSTPNTSPAPPGAPTGLAATQVTTTSVTLTWAAATPGCCPVEGYDITYLQAFNDIIWTHAVGNVTTVTITANIRPATEYRFSVSARDVAGHRSAGASISVVTPVTDTGDTTPPPRPSNLTASGTTGGRTLLSWMPPADTSDVAGYNVYGFDGWFVSTLLGTTTATTFEAPGVTGPLPQYYVRARDAAGNISLASNTVPAPTSSSPPGPSSSPSSRPPLCLVSYTNQAQWIRGFVAGITVTNTGSTAVDGWTVTFAFGGDQQVTGYWGAVVSQSGTAVTASNAPWNAVIQPGASVSFGLQGIWAASNAPPTAFSLNGDACAIA